MLPYLPTTRAYILVIGGLILLFLFSHFLSEHMEQQQHETWKKDHGHSAFVIAMIDLLDGRGYGVAPVPASPPRPQAVVPAPQIPAPAPAPVVGAADPRPAAAVSGSDKPIENLVFPPREPTSAMQAERAREAGCIAGRAVAARRATRFYGVGENPEAIADIGDAMTVARTNPVSGDKCDVIYDDPRQAGAVEVADIGPRSDVEAELASRSLNQATTVTLGAFQNNLAKLINDRAGQLKIVEGANFYETIDAVYAYVATCAGITEDDLHAASVARATTRETNDTYAKYSMCRTDILGRLFPTDPKNIYVRVESLRSADGKTPYHIRILFQSPRPMDGQPKTIAELFLDEFDIYGIGNFDIVP